MRVDKPNHKPRKPSTRKRGQFSKKTMEDIVERDDGLCVVCFKNADEIHHVKFKSLSGRGVFTNGVCLCREHHELAHSSREETERLENMMRDKYGDDFYRDWWDLNG